MSRQQQFIEMFNAMCSWQERFQYLIDLESRIEFPTLPERLRIPATRIMSCASRTYFYPFVSEGKIRVYGWSNASIPSGLIAVFFQLFDGMDIEEFRKQEIVFHTATGLVDNLTGSRREGLMEMLKKLSVLSS
ncbi:SufE family protein [Dysgonomonas sp. GY75]|uniref:SufE family protein n=1 Tax=Dysgonomonas sp. GY75 TaxID=2780419 RepID=UPI0018838630|nr:SufE family protein [Dysgonomonas sp. GY75]MBF0649185.1 SufE family protein [Dysgonomonas sp. GY75]